jgi:tetratricopeptide (TPR) repeat protein
MGGAQAKYQVKQPSPADNPPVVVNVSAAPVPPVADSPSPVKEKSPKAASSPKGAASSKSSTSPKAAASPDTGASPIPATAATASPSPKVVAPPKSVTARSANASPVANVRKLQPIQLDSNIRAVTSPTSAGGQGGLQLNQLRGALRGLLKQREDVFLLSHPDMIGQRTFDDLLFLTAIQKLKLSVMPAWVVFPYPLLDGHWVAVVVNTAHKKLIITDSLGEDRSSDVAYLEEAFDCRAVAGRSNFLNQSLDASEPWESGVFTIFNVVDQANKFKAALQTKPHLDSKLREVLKLAAAEPEERLPEEEMAEQERNRQKRRQLLEAMEQIRLKEGSFRNSSAADDLKSVADILSVEQWSNLQRKQAADPREREMSQLIASYEKSSSHDLLGILMLKLLFSAQQYDEFAAFHRQAVLHSRDFEAFTTSLLSSASKEEKQQVQFGIVCTTLGKFGQARECLFEVYRSLHSAQPKNIQLLGVCANALGTLYRKLGQHPHAALSFQCALRLFESDERTKSLNAAVTMCNYATLLFSLKRYDEARKMFERCIRELTQRLGSDLFHRQAADALLGYGRVLDELGEFPLAQEQLLHARVLYARFELASEATVCTHALGQLCRRAGTPTESVAYFRQALDADSKAVPVDTKKRAETAMSLATALIDDGQIEEAQTHLDAALAVFLPLAPKEQSLEVATVYLYKGTLCRMLTKPDLAAAHELHQKSLDIRTALLGGNSAAVAESLSALGEDATLSKEYGEAVSYFDRVLKIRNSVFGASHPTVADVLCLIGDLSMETGFFQKALNCYKQALSFVSEGSDRARIATAQDRVGCAYFGLNELQSALDSHLLALDSRKQMLGATSPALALSYHHVAEDYFKLRRFKKAAELHATSLANKRQWQPVRPLNLAATLVSLAKAEHALGHFEQSLAHQLEAISLNEQVFGLQHIHLCELLFNCAETYIKQVRFDEATALLTRLLHIALHQHPPNRKWMETAKTTLRTLK